MIDMSKKNYILIILIILFTSLFSTSTRAQTLELNSKQSLTVSGPGFFAFSTISNNQLKEVLPTNPNITLEFSNFLGSPCAVAPANDFSEIGPQIIVSANGTITVDFSMASQNVDLFGLSLVPNSGTCIFDLLITPQEISSSSSSGTTSIETLTPNSLTVIGKYLSESLITKLSNENTNPNCQNSPFGIETLTINGLEGDDNFQLIINDLGVTQITSQRTNLNRTFKEDSVLFTLPSNKKVAMTVYDQKLTNNTDMTKIFATVLFPSDANESTIMLGSRTISPEIEITLKEQNIVALAAVQHAIVSATMPWQLSTNGGFFIVQGGGCVGAFCTIVESGMVVIDPDGACTPKKLNKRKAGYPTVNPSKFFDPFPFSQSIIQIPTENIVNPKHPLVAKVVRDRAYLILQPVPPKTKLIQQLKLSLTNNNN